MVTKKAKEVLSAQSVARVMDEAEKASGGKSLAVVPTHLLPPNARTTLPSAPTNLVGAFSREMVTRIKMLGANGSPEALTALESVPTRSLHPTVGNYKAEMLEYLRVKHRG